MDYFFTGDFIEACDCFVVCPCWVDDDPDGGHCTGLFAWLIDADREPAPASKAKPEPKMTIDGVGVAGRTVVALTTHSGNRRGTGASTVLYVDDRATADQFTLLTRAFAGELEGPLADLAAVSGAVLSRKRARITVDPGTDGWTVTVTLPEDPGTVPVIRATGGQRTLENEDAALTLRHTALSHELGIGGAEVTTQLGGELSVRVGALAGGYVEVTGRSGMRGRFSYRLPARQGAITGPEPAETGTEAADAAAAAARAEFVG
jgi:hypothetical protein